MSVVQLKVEKNAKLAKYISLIRKFDPTLSVGQIKNNIENSVCAVSFDLDYFDVLEAIQGIDRKSVFRDLIEQLIAEGAQLHIYVKDELWTLEHLDNWLHTMQEISKQTERDSELESEDE
jgi:hypothetical protein